MRSHGARSNQGYNVWGTVMLSSRAPWLGVIIWTLPMVGTTALLGIAASTTAQDQGRAPDDTRTYRFTARIKSNGGVTPFKAGEALIGVFTYDLRGRNKVAENPTNAVFQSARNSISFQVGERRTAFAGVGEVRVT